MRKLVILGLVWAMTAVLPPSRALAMDQGSEGSLRFETTVPFTTGKVIALNATVGPVKVRSVELSQASGGGSGVESVVEKIRGGGASGTQTTLRAAFDTENPKEDEWVVTYTLDFLDKDGKLIDRASKKEGFEGEAKVYRFDHPILQYVVPFISKVKIQLEARYD